MNDYDSARIVDLLGEELGYEQTTELEEADLVVINTCSIREKAQEKVFSDLGRIREVKKLRPEMKIAVGGCVASQEGEGVVKRAPWVDVVFGPQTLHRLPELLKKFQIIHLCGQGKLDSSLDGVNGYRQYEYIKKELADILGKGIEVRFSKKISGGFTVGPKDGGYFISFTDETFIGLISEYLRPATKKILFG